MLLSLYLHSRDAVGVAERLRRQVVALEIEGSNPSAHPILIQPTAGARTSAEQCTGLRIWRWVSQTVILRTIYDNCVNQQNLALKIASCLMAICPQNNLTLN